MALLADFSRGDNYAQGVIDKLITVGTPHLGTPLAPQLLGDGTNGQPNNTCVRDHLADKGNISFLTLTISGVQVPGAVGDLAGDGFGGSLSGALGAINQNHQTFPIASIAGVAN